MNEIELKISKLLKSEKYPPLLSPLPSQGLIYPNEHYFNSLKQVIYRKLTIKDEEWCSEAFFVKNTQLINLVLQDKILFNDKGISIYDFLPCDRDIMIINHIITSYGYEYNKSIKLNCLKCSNEITSNLLEIKRIKFEKLKLNPYNRNTNSFKWKSPDNRYEIIFKFPTIRDYQYVKNIQEIDIHQWSSLYILSINGFKYVDIEQINEIPFNTFIEFQEFVNDNEPYVQFETNDIICVRCSTNNKIQSKILLEHLQLNTPEKRKQLTKQMYNLSIVQKFYTLNELYNMPIDNVRRIIEQHVEHVKEENNKAGNK